MEVILEDFDPITAGGFTMVPNVILTNHDLSPGAKLVYAELLRFAWQKDSCFPGQGRLADDMGVSRRSVNSYLKELEKIGYLQNIRRGLNKTNVYILHCKIRRMSKICTSRSETIADKEK